ncbi:protein kinase domain-containing protein [Nonomuraea polychroma]|uniref:serine/threonine-protein kinase n=1 Tax=Nonomuraea polychroma TaxID=46176 RepID=UPI003D8D909E
MPDVRAMIAGRYQLIELIGRGGMAEVWRGLDQRMDTFVAIKLLNPLTGGVAAAERFAREARAAAQIVHRNVVTVLDVGHDTERRYLVMELLSGRSLADELAARGRLPIDQACALLAQAAAGLAAAHQAGVIHRDIKPANLHQTADGTLKVVDFGLAHVAGETARLTTVGTIVGTAAYLAPEQIDGTGGEAASDLYALGCVAYELLCGRPPFIGTPPELIYQHVHHTPDAPRRHRPDLPAELDQLIMALLAKNPAQRPAGAEEVQRVLIRLAGPGRVPGWHAAPAAAAVPPAPCPPAARAGDTAVLDAPPSSAAPVPPWRRMLVQVTLAVAAIMIVTAAAIALSPGTEPVTPPETSLTASAPPVASKRPSASAPATADSTTRPTPRTSATASPSRPASQDRQDPRAWLAALNQAVTAQQRRGGISDDLAAKAHEKIRDAAAKLADGKTQEAREKIQELGRDLSQARREGKLADGPLTAFLARAGLG